MSELNGMVDAYVKEARTCPLTATEIKEEYDLIPIREKGDPIGFFGVFFSDNDTGLCAIVAIVYIQPDKRDNAGRKLRKYFYQLTKMCKERGVKYLQVDAERAIGLIIEKYSRLKPVSYRYIAPVEEWPTAFK